MARFFFADGKLKKILGTRRRSNHALQCFPMIAAATWSEDGTIVFHSFLWVAPLSGISSAGDALQVLTSLDRRRLEKLDPPLAAVPARRLRRFCFTSSTAVGNYEGRRTSSCIPWLPDRSKRVQGAAGFHRTLRAPQGHMVYTHEGTLFAAPF